MAKNHQSFKSLFGTEIQKEINLLPQELIKKKREIEEIKKDIINIKEKFQITEKQLKSNNNEIIIEEKNLSKLLSKKYSIKCIQKGLIKSINKEFYFFLIKSLINKENKNFKEIILLFFNFKKEYKDELQFIIQNKESFIELMNNSYKNIKLLFKEDINRYKEIKQSIINIINNNGYINIDKIKYPFNIIIEFILNCLEIINFKIKIKEIKEIIKKKNIKKNTIFINKIFLENEIEEKEQKLINLKTYCENIYNIIEKNKNNKNGDTEKEIIDMQTDLQKKYILDNNNKCKKENIKEINNVKVKVKEKKISNIKIKIGNDKEKERIKSKKNISSKEPKIKDKIIYKNNKNNKISNFTQNKTLKELSCIELIKPNHLNKNRTKNDINPRIKINICPFTNKIKSVNSINNNKTVNPKRKKNIILNSQNNFNNSAEKKQVNKIFFPYNYSRFGSINNRLKKHSNMISSYNNLLMREYHKSPTYEISLNKSMGLLDDKFLKTEQGNNNKYININLEKSRVYSKLMNKKNL